MVHVLDLGNFTHLSGSSKALANNIGNLIIERQIKLCSENFFLSLFRSFPGSRAVSALYLEGRGSRQLMFPAR
jgi:hypothetical protein